MSSRAAWALACLALSAAAAAASPADQGGFWMKRYPSRGYGAFWHLELGARDFVKARKAVERTLAKSRGKELVAPANQVGSDKVKYMQWSLALSRADAAKAWARLEKEGAVLRATQQEDLEPEIPREAAVKLDKLKAERAAAGALLDRFPSTRAAVDEILAHLQAVVGAWDASQDKVLLNLSLEERR